MNSPELDELRVAIEKYVATLDGGDNALVSQSIVVWECVGLGDDGEAMRSMSYTVPTENGSPSGALGLLEAGHVYLSRDIFGRRRD